jgi:hypothetical protein
MAEPASWVQGVRITGPLAPFADGYRVKLRDLARISGSGAIYGCCYRL